VTRAESLALEATSIAKHFGGTPALVDASIRVRRGTVHALLGGNGSGKSTLIKCLAGVHSADAGSVAFRGECLAAAGLTPRRAHAAGLRFVHQDLGLFESLTVAENFALSAGFPTGPAGGIRWRRLRDRVAELLALYRIDAHPETEIGALRPATKTLVAIARALQDQQDSEFVLLLDEPTASLPDAESRTLMTALRHRADSGQTIVLVSHRLPEVLDVADDFTVFRDGRVAGSLVGVSPSEDDLVELMTGRRPAARTAATDSRTRGGPALEVENLTIGPLRGLNLEVAAGEIVGLCGLLGSGRSTLLSTIFGLRAPIRGSIRLAGEEIASRSVQEVMRRGVALIPQSRLRDAAFAGMSVRENVSVAVLRRYFSGWMRGRAERTDAIDLVRRFGVKAPSTEVPLAALSGGNQQKLVLARWLRREPRLLLLDEPTQGVDAAARTEIHAVIREAAARGCAVLVASSDFPELAQLCHRVDVLRGGRVALEVTGPDLTANHLTELAQKEVLPA
jgi:ABC-type sugar transport system ATPase subunit